MIVAGIDIGNSTTEIVIVDSASTPPRPIAWDRVPTRGRKGSADAAAASAVVLRRLARRADVLVERVVIAPQHAVDSSTLLLPDPPRDTGRLQILGAGRSTPAGVGFGVGRPVAIEDDPITDGTSVILVARDPRGYRVTSERIHVWFEAGADVAGILLAGDEAVLVSNRLPSRVPVIDQVDPLLALSMILVAVEVSGSSLRELTDPVRLAALLGLDPEEHPTAEIISEQLRGLRDAAVAISPHRVVLAATDRTGGQVSFNDGSARTLLEFSRMPGPARSARSIRLPGSGSEQVITDSWAVDLDTVTDSAAMRPQAVDGRAIALATLTEYREDFIDGPARTLAAHLAVQVTRVATESRAARVGALTTPAARPGALILDLGGGTIDVAPADSAEVVVAGAGDLLTAAVAHLLDIPRGAAEWVKREPSARLDGPHVLVGEDGVRRFVDVPVPSDAVGALVVPGPAGLLPFHSRLAPGEWRMLRQHLKRAVISDNVSRAATDIATDVDVLLVGGPAGDVELLDMVVRALPGCVPGRADVAGELGHRWAVAYGLTVLDQLGESSVIS